jgi:flavin reductase (DIM6/NTAB) family NADH-FMN oxidoreductase RutF
VVNGPEILYHSGCRSPIEEKPMKRSLGAKTLIYPTPVWIVGTYDRQEKPNGMTAAWGGICCSDPPCVAVALRKSTYSYASLLDRQAFTINVPSQKYVKAVDYFGLVSGHDTDKFAATGLTAVRSQLVDAPYIQEFPLVLECKLAHVFELGLHTQFVGEVIDVKAEEGVLDAKGMPDMLKVLPMIFSPGNQVYYGVGATLGQGFSIGKEIAGDQAKIE